MAPPAIPEDKSRAVHPVMSNIAMLDAPSNRMTGFTGDRRRIAVTAPACLNSIFNLLITATVTSLTIGKMGCVNVSEGPAGMGGISGCKMAGDGAIGSRTQPVMAGIAIMIDNGRVAGGAGIDETVFRHIMTCCAVDQGNRRSSGGVTGITFLYIMEPVQQATLGVALGSGAFRSHGDIIGVQHIMDSRLYFIGMTIQTTRLQAIGYYLGHGPAGGSPCINVTGGLMTCGTRTAIGWDVM